MLGLPITKKLEMSYKKNALIFGSNSGIGFALVQNLLADDDFDQVVGTYNEDSSNLEKIENQKLKIIKLNAFNEHDF